MMTQTKYTGDVSIGRSYRYQVDITENTYSDNEWKTIERISVWSNHISKLRSEMEQILNLEDLLSTEIFTLIYLHGTSIQINVAKLIYQGHTQMEIAKILGCCQTSVQKCLQGNYDQKHGKKFGGLRIKLIKLIKASPAIKKIMQDMYQLDPNGCKVPYYQTISRHAFDNYHLFYQWLNYTNTFDNTDNTNEPSK